MSSDVVFGIYFSFIIVITDYVYLGIGFINSDKRFLSFKINMILLVVSSVRLYFCADYIILSYKFKYELEFVRLILESLLSLNSSFKKIEHCK